MSKRDKNTVERKSLWYQSWIVLLVTNACTFHTEEGISWHFLGLVVYYDMDNHVIICSDFKKLFEFLMEESEVGQLSQYSDSLQDEWQMLDSQKEQEFFSSPPHSDLCRYSGYSRSRWLDLEGDYLPVFCCWLFRMCGALPQLSHSSLWHSAFRYRDRGKIFKCPSSS